MKVYKDLRNIATNSEGKGLSINLSSKQFFQKMEWGDFQTPKLLADLMASILRDNYHFSPSCILEPTCGKGNILLSFAKLFPSSQKNIGIEINSQYFEELEKIRIEENLPLSLWNADFFTFDFQSILGSEKKSILLVGNPPWVTNSDLGKMGSKNLPPKSNFKNLKGMDALTGKSNFDLSEYIILKLVDLFFAQDCLFAFLCKTSVARKILISFAENGIQPERIDLYPIDSKKCFQVSVDACLFVFQLGPSKNKIFCNVYQSIEDRRIVNTIGVEDGIVASNMQNFSNLKKFIGKSKYIWRNGIKHDASGVMELSLDENHFLFDRKGNFVDIEKDLVYPVLKSSDLAKGNRIPRKAVIVTQKKIGENTDYIENYHPKTWKYLNENLEAFAIRKSSIYKNKPLFSIFSVGEYAFYPYKIAISALYKNIRFSILEPYQNKPIQVDDTCNFISCKTLEEAEFVYKLLNSTIVQDLLGSLVFWDSKRPITTAILNKLDLQKIAQELHFSKEYNSYAS